MSMNKVILAVTAAVFALAAVEPALAVDKVERQQKRIIRLIHRADLNGDKMVSRQELATQLGRTFAALDTNHDGGLSLTELQSQKSVMKAERQKFKALRTSGQHVKGLVRMPKAVAKHFDKLDANHDGVLTSAELNRVAERMFARRDKNKDGFLSKDDFAA